MAYRDGEDIAVPDGAVGDIVWSWGMRIRVLEREEFDAEGGRPRVVQLRGPVLNWLDLDPVTRAYVRSASDDRPWWVVQGNRLARVFLERDPDRE